VAVGTHHAASAGLPPGDTLRIRAGESIVKSRKKKSAPRWPIHVVSVAVVAGALYGGYFAYGKWQEGRRIDAAAVALGDRIHASLDAAAKCAPPENAAKADAAAALAGPGDSEHASLRQSKAYQDDGKWWMCDPVEISNRCKAGPLAALGLSAEEMAFVKEKLDAIPLPPAQVQKESVENYLGQPADPGLPQSNTFTNYGPGTHPQRGVTVSHQDGRLVAVRWFQPGRFMLSKTPPP